MKNRILCVLAFVPILFFAACHDGASDEASIDGLYGTWIDTVAYDQSIYTVQELTFERFRKFSSKTFLYGRTLQGAPLPAGELSSWHEISGDFIPNGHKLKLHAKKSSYQDVHGQGDVTVEAVDYQLFDNCTYALQRNEKELELTYITAPADAPEKTQATFVKKD